MVRAFSLLETMIVVAMLGVIATLAVPNLQPMLKSEGLVAAGASVAGFVTQARVRAMTDRRCVRVRIDSATNPAVLVAEKLNAFDCENPSAPLIESTAPLWTEVARLRLEQETLVLSLAPAPSDTPGELRFRPSGRLFSADDDLNDDDAIVQVRQPALPPSLNLIRVVVDAPGPVCALPPGAAASGAGNSLGCP